MPKRAFLFRSILVLFSTVAALFLCEIFFRLYYPPPQTVYIRSKESIDNVNERADNSPPATHDDSWAWVGDLYIQTDTGMRLRPHTEVTVENHVISGRNIVLRTNRLGYRGPELRDEVKRRILFLGDSITFSDSVNEEETFVRIVERQARARGLDWETMNAGIGSISLETELAILKETGIATQPDVVVIGFYLNDFQDSGGVIITDIPRWIGWSRMLYALALKLAPAHLDTTLDLNQWRQEFVAQNMLEYGDFDKSEMSFNALVVHHFNDWGGAYSHHAWERIEILIEEFERLSVVHGFTPAIVVFPVRYQVGLSFSVNYPQLQMQRITSNLNVPLLDLLPHMDSWYEGGLKREDLFYDQCHPKPIGQEKIAEVIFDFLQRLNLDSTESG